MVQYYAVISSSKFFSIPANTTQAVQVQYLTNAINTNMGYLVASIGCVLFVLLLSLVVAARIMTARVLVSMSLTFVNNVLIVFGLIFVVAGAYIAAVNGAGALGGLMDVLGYIIGLGAIFMLVSVLGHCGQARKHNVCLIVYAVLALGLLGASAGATYMCFNNVAYVQAWLLTQNDKSLGLVASSLGFSMDVGTMLGALKNNLGMIGLSFGCIMILQVIAVLSTGLFMWAVKSWKVENGVSWGCLEEEEEGVEAIRKGRTLP